MPDLSEYRRRFGDFHAELEEDAWLCRSGGRTASERPHVTGEYSDLFTIRAMSDLATARGEVALETERRAVDRLRAFAIFGFVGMRASGIEAEIERHISASVIEHRGQPVPFRRLDSCIAAETRAADRRELAGKRSDLSAGASDLYGERLDIWKRSLFEAGLTEGFSGARRELLGDDQDSLADRAEGLLAGTESGYIAELSAILPAETGVSIDDATDADLDHLDCHSSFDAWFSSGRMVPLCHEIFDGFGFRVAGQKNLRLTRDSGPGAACFPVRVPGDIRLSVEISGTQKGWRSFFGAAGRAQNYAWTSVNLAPEFRCISQWGDSALSNCWAGLIAGIISEKHWLQGSLGLIENAKLRRLLRLVRLIRIRRAAAGHLFDLESLGSDSRTDLFRSHADRMGDALKIRCDSAGALIEISPGFSHGNALRGAALEAQLRDHLKTRFGERWWTSRKAGEMIIDLWNMGQRYSAEELAGIVGLGDLDFDWLAADLVN